MSITSYEVIFESLGENTFGDYSADKSTLVAVYQRLYMLFSSFKIGFHLTEIIYQLYYFTLSDVDRKWQQSTHEHNLL